MYRLAPPDLAKLQSVSKELARLIESNTVSKLEFTRLLDEANDAVGEQTQYLESILIRGLEARVSDISADSALVRSLTHGRIADQRTRLRESTATNFALVRQERES